ncbi:MAG: hypothetical protein WBM13_01510 [Bacteroidia bacterium]
MKVIRLLILIFVALFYAIIASAQTGTIRVQKKGQLLKTQFDNVNYRLVGIDQYGNVIDSAVIEYEVAVTVRGLFYAEKTVGPYLSSNLQQILNRADQTTVLSFDKIKAKDRNGTIIDMPKIKSKIAYDSREYGE